MIDGCFVSYPTSSSPLFSPNHVGGEGEQRGTVQCDSTCKALRRGCVGVLALMVNVTTPARWKISALQGNEACMNKENGPRPHNFERPGWAHDELTIERRSTELSLVETEM